MATAGIKLRKDWRGLNNCRGVRNQGEVEKNAAKDSWNGSLQKFLNVRSESVDQLQESKSTPYIIPLIKCSN
jgi:hypothetical protein